MAISDRQAAAIQRRKRQERVDRDLAAERARTGHLMGFEDGPEQNPDVVGWCQKTPTSLKGMNHLCRRCSPERPLGYQAVFLVFLSATQACTRCGDRLDAVVEKK